MTPEEAYDALFDRAVRHRIDLERYSAGEVRDVLRFIKTLEADTLKRLAALVIDADLARSDRLRADSLEGFLRQLRLIYAEGYAKLRKHALASMDDLAGFEAEFQTKSLAAATDDLMSAAGGAVEELRSVAAGGVLSPNVAQLRAVIRSRPLQTDSKSALLSVWFDDLESAGIRRVEDALKIGFAQGEGIKQLQERLRNVWTLNERGAEAVIRTAITHVAAEVAQETYEANPELVPEIEWVAILDGRTTPICRARDGKRFLLNGGPRPPAHIRCRSTVIPVVLDMPKIERPTYSDWLKRQSAEKQDDILGPARGKLFRAGGMTVDRFVSPDGRPLTLAQIRTRNPDAFARAGITGIREAA